MPGLFPVAVIVASLIFSCSKKDDGTEPEQPYQPHPYSLEIPYGFPTQLNIPSDNPLTEEGVALGRYLFYDGRLGGRDHPDSLMSCATCHLQQNAFECGTDHPVYTNGFTHGINGKPTPHVMLPLFNLVWNSNGYFWNGLVGPDNPDEHYRNIEDIVWMGVVVEHEMDSDTNRVRELIQSIPGYPDLFEKAFGSRQVTMRNIGRAVAQFIRTITSAESKFDRYLRGEEQLSPQELNGFVLFTTEEGADCFHCHGGSGNPLFTTNKFYNNGKDSLFTGPYEDPRDRYHVTGDPMDLGAYKAPTLRNIIFTAPYMHDGRFATLDSVIHFYNTSLVWSPYIDPLMHHIANGGTQMIPQEVSDLKAFILSLTDYQILSDPDLGPPEKFPDEE
ncbi:MAG: hypothetical protein JW861_02235 [Bacteroidales bacterium]|nr:hypothetical protein [Bacteroidales bacterium]